MQPARGTVHTVGLLTIITNAKTARYCEDFDLEDVVGVVVEMTDEQVRLAGAMVRTTVEVWPACAEDLAPGECTPENYAHLKQRLAAAADNLSREVRSNEAAALVRADLEERLALGRETCLELHAEVDRLAAELAEALNEARRLREEFGVPEGMPIGMHPTED